MPDVDVPADEIQARAVVGVGVVVGRLRQTGDDRAGLVEQVLERVAVAALQARLEPPEQGAGASSRVVVPRSQLEQPLLDLPLLGDPGRARERPPHHRAGR